MARKKANKKAAKKTVIKNKQTRKTNKVAAQKTKGRGKGKRIAAGPRTGNKALLAAIQAIELNNQHILRTINAIDARVASFTGKEAFNASDMENEDSHPLAD